MIELGEHNHSIQRKKLSLFPEWETLVLMKKIIQEYKDNLTIRNLSARIVKALPSSDYLEEAKAIFYFVRDNIRYLRDIQGKEVLQSPLVTLPTHLSEPGKGIGMGDCDDHSILLATMLLSIGHRNVGLRAIKTSKSRPSLNHAYVISKYNGKIYHLDAILKNKPFNTKIKSYDELILWL